jgi:hypothetical protein
MSLGSRGPVVIDTGVFAARLTPSGSLLAARYPLVAHDGIFASVKDLELLTKLGG